MTAIDGDGVTTTPGPTFGVGVATGAGVVGDEPAAAVGFLVSSDLVKLLAIVGPSVTTGSLLSAGSSAVTGRSDGASVDFGGSVGLVVFSTSKGGLADTYGAGVVGLAVLGSAVGAEDGMAGQNSRDAGVVSSCV